jgi:membrane protein DedA with SNARE-associated domain
MVELIGSWIIHFISALGYFGIFLLMTLESALVPIPSEVTMPFAGSLVALGEFNFWVVVLVGTLGNLFGSLLAYALGWWGQEAIVRKVIIKYGKYLFITEHEYDRSERWFKNHGELIVFVSRVLPVLRTFISLPAGVAKMNVKKFITYTVVGCFIWSIVLTQIGVILGNNWKSLEVYFRKFDLVIVVAAVALAVWFLWKKFRWFR